MPTNDVIIKNAFSDLVGAIADDWAGVRKFMQEETKKEIIEAKLQLGEYTPTVDMTVPQWCLPVAA